jgi:hypothetical protein
MRATIKAELVKARDLKPGELFSTLGADYWDYWDKRGSIGESVYIRTNQPAEAAPDADEEVYRITVCLEQPAIEIVNCDFL